MRLGIKQKSSIFSPNKKTLVISPPGGGKTMCLTERIKYLINNGATDKNIVVITFTNNAAAELKSRLNIEYDKLFIGTIHSYANFLLTQNGIKTYKYLQEENFDALFNLVKLNQWVIPKIDHLLVDEAQDSSKEHFEFFEMLKPVCWTYYADPRQSIYSFIGAFPKYIEDLYYKDDVVVYELNVNYRCGRDIIQFAKGMVKDEKIPDRSAPARNVNGKVVEVYYDLASIVNGIMSMDEYGDWFILTRTNKELEQISNFLKKRSVPFVTFKQNELTNDRLNKELKSNKVKLLTIHAAKGLESKNVVVVGAKFYNEEEKRISYVAATRAKDLLIWTKKRKKGR